MDNLKILSYYNFRSSAINILKNTRVPLKDRVPGISIRFENWISYDDDRRCDDCAQLHGKIMPIFSLWDKYPPIHILCRCVIEKMLTLKAGTVTDLGAEGADWYLKYLNQLPFYYISKLTAQFYGWNPSKKSQTVDKVAPGKMIGGDEYKNKNGHLPTAPNRKWYEADIDYISGKRNRHRIMYSSDGLMFVTYDHYESFYEII